MATRKPKAEAAPPVKTTHKPSKAVAPTPPKPKRTRKEPVELLYGTEPGAADHSLTPEQLEMGLRRTGTPGVYLNKVGQMVDADGVMLDYTDVKSRDDARFERIIGEPVDTPAKLLKAVALDPQQTMVTRIDAAKAAAPYYDRKKPIGIDGGDDGKPIEILHRHKLQGMTKEELDQLERLLKMTGSPLLGIDDEAAQSQ
jgi:hypothetical protein